MRKTTKVFCIAALMGLLMSPGAIPMADAANLKARSQTLDPVTGFPTWYQDNNNLALTACFEAAFCPPLDVPQASFPATSAGINAQNFPPEHFYFMADTAGTSPGGTIDVILYEAALEAGFAVNVVDGDQAFFTRIRCRANVTLPGTYTLTHPYGVETFVVDAIVPGPEINFTEDVPGLVAGAFDAALTSRVGPFLTRADGTFVTDPVSGSRFIGIFGAPVAFTGSPMVPPTNFVRITGPTADTFQSDTLALSGKVMGMDVAPSSNRDLGAVIMLNPAAPQTFTITNTTGNPITFGPIALAGVDALDFAVSPPPAPAVDCANATIPAAAPDNTCGFDVTFTPAAAAKGVRTATIALAPTTVQPVPPVVPAIDDPPPVTMNLKGTALVTVAATAAANGTITPVIAAGLPAGTAPAGTAVTFTVTPSNSKFKVRDVLDGATPVAGPPFTINTADVNHTVTASFMPSGNLTGSGTPGLPDAIKALRIAVALDTPTDEDKLAMDVAPLGADGRPAGDQAQDLRDVLLVLRRVLGVVTW